MKVNLILNLNLPFRINSGLTFPQFFDVFLCQDPRVVSRSPAERLNARGSSPPRGKLCTRAVRPVDVI